MPSDAHSWLKTGVAVGLVAPAACSTAPLARRYPNLCDLDRWRRSAHALLTPRPVSSWSPPEAAQLQQERRP